MFATLLPFVTLLSDASSPLEAPLCGGRGAYCQRASQCCSSRCSVHRCALTLEEEQAELMKMLKGAAAGSGAHEGAAGSGAHAEGAAAGSGAHAPVQTCGGKNAHCTAPQECCSSRCDGAHRCRPTLEEELAEQIELMKRKHEKTKEPAFEGAAAGSGAHAEGAAAGSGAHDPVLTCGRTGAFCTRAQQCCSSYCSGAHHCRPVYEEEEALRSRAPTHVE